MSEATGTTPLQGYLKQKSGKFFKKRFFTIEDGQKIVSFDKETLVDSINISSITSVEASGKGQFVIKCGDEETILCAPQNDDAVVTYWVDGLNGMISGGSTSSPATPGRRGKPAREFGTPKSPRHGSNSVPKSPRLAKIGSMFKLRSSRSSIPNPATIESAESAPEAALSRSDSLSSMPLKKSSTQYSPQVSNTLKLAETAFLEYRRLLLKSTLAETHLSIYIENQKVNDVIDKMEQTRKDLRDKLVSLDEELRQVRSQGSDIIVVLEKQFADVVQHVKSISGGSLEEAHAKLQEDYQDIMTNPTTPERSLSDVRRSAQELRILTGMLESFLLLIQPLNSHEETLQVRKREIAKECDNLALEEKELQRNLDVARAQLQKTKQASQTCVSLTESLISASELKGGLGIWANHLSVEKQKMVEYQEDSILDMIHREGGDDISFGPDGELVAASVDRMLQLLIFGKGKQYGSTFQQSFLLTFRTFISPVNLLEKLMIYYCATAPGDNSDKSTTSLLTPMRIRSLNLLKQWISYHLYDFNDKRLTLLLSSFINNTLKVSGFEKIGDKLNSLLQGTGYPEPKPFPDPLLPENDDYSLLNISPVEFARQITLQDVALFQSIEVKDLLNQAWTSKNPKIAKTVKSMIQLFNDTASWVTGTVILEEDVEVRVKYISHFLKIAKECLALNNFNGTVKIVAALCAQSLYRLKKTWEKVPKEDKKYFEYLKTLQAKNFTQLRSLHASCTPPCIPYMGAYLTDLVYIGEMKTRINGLLSFRKVIMTGEAIAKIILHRDTMYWLKDVQAIKSLMSDKSKKLTEDEAWKQSQKLEPREKRK